MELLTEALCWIGLYVVSLCPLALLADFLEGQQSYLRGRYE